MLITCSIVVLTESSDLKRSC